MVVQNVNGSPGNAIFGEKEHFAGRKRYLTDTIGDIRFVISPRSFFPANRNAALLVYEKVRECRKTSAVAKCVATRNVTNLSLLIVRSQPRSFGTITLCPRLETGNGSVTP